MQRRVAQAKDERYDMCETRSKQGSCRLGVGPWAWSHQRAAWAWAWASLSSHNQTKSSVREGGVEGKTQHSFARNSKEERSQNRVVRR